MRIVKTYCPKLFGFIRSRQIWLLLVIGSAIIFLAEACQSQTERPLKPIAELGFLAQKTINPTFDTVAFQVAGFSKAKGEDFLKRFSGPETEYALLLQQVTDTAVVLPMIVQQCEAQELAVAIEKMSTQRPILSVLLQTIIQKTGYRLNRVVIDRLENRVFFATMYLVGPQNQQLAIDSRPTDAITQALRFNCPLYVLRSVVRDGQNPY